MHHGFIALELHIRHLAWPHVLLVTVTSSDLPTALQVRGCKRFKGDGAQAAGAAEGDAGGGECWRGTCLPFHCSATPTTKPGARRLPGTGIHPTVPGKTSAPFGAGTGQCLCQA